MGILAFVILLWVSRKPGVEGWSALFLPGFVTDTQPAILGTILMCIWPAVNPFSSFSANGRFLTSRSSKITIITFVIVV